MAKKIDSLGKITILDPVKLMRDMERRRKREQKDLEARAKPLYELTREEFFTVQGVLQESYSHSVTPTSEIMIGGRSPSYGAGYSTHATITVMPDNSKLPIKTFIFEGPVTLRKGDRVSATIPRYEKHECEEERFGCHVSQRVIYTDRPYKEQEEAVQIITMREDERGAVRTDRSANYRRFTKE